MPMILRAVFWIAVVAILMPREPDLGLGRPGASGNLFAKIGHAVEPGQASCKDNEMACVAATGVLGKIQGVTLQGLAEVKAEIEEAKRERSLRKS
jgi:hypothetical protein